MNQSIENGPIFGAASVVARPTRSLAQAMWRGFCSRCPHCGEGKLFRAFVKPVDACAKCGEEFHHQRADDLPAYLTITIVGHIVVAAFMAIETVVILPLWAHMAIWGPVIILMSLLLLQPIKGATIGLQWANYMHGFGGEADHI